MNDDPAPASTFTYTYDSHGDLTHVTSGDSGAADLDRWAAQFERALFPAFTFEHDAA